MFLTSLFIIAIVVQLAVVTFHGRDIWPFSHYPMFSGLKTRAEVEIYRVALETADGELHWWRSRFYRYPERVGRDWQQAEFLGRRSPALTLLERRRLLAEVIRLLQLEEGDVSRYSALYIVRRTAAWRMGVWVVNDRLVATHKGLKAGGSVGRSDR